MCVFCFLLEENQKKLRYFNQLRTDRFEVTLEKYKEHFVREFFESLKKPVCSLHSTEMNDKLKNKLNYDLTEDEINKYFDLIIDIYISWIDSKFADSLQSMKRIVLDIEKGVNEIYSEYKILENISDRILFRGRQSNVYISHWDMFHIPYNKRYMIRNQRYSLGGQPLLYLSYSPWAIAREIDCNQNDLYISSFVLKKDFTLKIYDNRNIINKLIELNKNHILKVKENRKNSKKKESALTINDLFKGLEGLDGLKIDFSDRKVEGVELKKDRDIDKENLAMMLNLILQPSEELKIEINKEKEDIINRIDVVSLIKQHILYSVCSFRKRQELQNSHFIEEYVLPQILAATLKELDYQGVMFLSTQSSISDLISDYQTELNNFMFSHVAIFTSYDKEKRGLTTYTYDEELYENFIISRPLANVKNLMDETSSNLKRSVKEISKEISEGNRKELWEYISYSLNSLVTNISNSINLKSENYSNEDKCHEEKKRIEYYIELHKFLLQTIVLDSDIFNIEEK